jgi:hypothetical protein
MNARNLIFHLARGIHWRAGLGRGKGFYIGILGNIASETQMVWSEFGGGLGGDFSIAGDERDLRTLGGVGLGAVETDAGGATGEKDDLVLEKHGKI